MLQAFNKAFIEHPATVGENYFSHGRFALWFSMMLFAAGLAALTHAVLPFAFKSTGSDVVKRLNGVLSERAGGKS